MAFQPVQQPGGSARTMLQPRRPAGHRQNRKGAQPRRALITRLMLYLLPHKLLLALVFVLIVIYTVLGLIGPYLMGVAIDKFIGGQRSGRVDAHCLVDVGGLRF